MEHHFNTDHAKKYGVDEAIVINSFKHWIEKNRASRVNSKGGHTWTYNSLNALCELFPYWTRRQLERITKSLIDQGVLQAEQLMLDKGDQRLWYAFADEKTFLEPVGDHHQTVTVDRHETVETVTKRGRHRHQTVTDRHETVTVSIDKDSINAQVMPSGNASAGAPGAGEGRQDSLDTPRSQPAPKANPDVLRRVELFGFDPVPLVEGRAYFNRSLGNLDWPELKAQLQGFAERGSVITEAQFRQALKVGYDACQEKHGSRPKSLVWLISALADLDTSDGEPAPTALTAAPRARTPEMPSQYERVKLEKLWGRSIADGDREGQERYAAGIRSLYEASAWTGPALEKSVHASRDGARDWAQRFQRQDRFRPDASLTATS